MKFPLTKLEEIDGPLSAAILEACGEITNMQTHPDCVEPSIGLDGLIRWHKQANDDPGYIAAIEAGILALANSIHRERITNNDDPDTFRDCNTYWTDSDEHNDLLVRLGIYSENEDWRDDHSEYFEVRWRTQRVPLGLPFGYPHGLVELSYIIHKKTGDYTKPEDSDIVQDSGEYYTAKSYYEALLKLDTADELGLAGDTSPEDLSTAVYMFENAGVPIAWAISVATHFEGSIPFKEGDWREYAKWIEYPSQLEELDDLTDAMSAKDERWSDFADAVTAHYLAARQDGHPHHVVIASYRFGAPSREILAHLANLHGVSYEYLSALDAGDDWWEPFLGTGKPSEDEV